MEELQIFNNEEFGNVRSLMIDNEPWLVGKDVATDLGYQNGSRDINRHVDEEDRRKVMVFDGKQNKETIVINESGLYALVFGSNLPSAKKFKHWVTSEVLPTLRKTGSYAKVPTDPRELLMLTIKAHEQTAQRVDVLEEKVSDLEKSTTMTVLNNIRLKKLLKQQQLEHWAVLIQELTN